MKGKILIVDDQFGIRMLLQELFQREGYQTFQAADGKKALEIVTTHDPDIVLLDMKIPGMDGLEILKHIKANDPDCKVLVMTAYGELGMIQEAMDMGAIAYVAKPFDIMELRDQINRLLTEHVR
ncbi:MAG: response regulator [Caldibacillus sp.]